MKRYALGLLLAITLLAVPATGAGAQGDAGCDTLSAAEAQSLLDNRPTYANRDLLDPDGDGVACEPDELAAAPAAEGCDPARAAAGAADPAGAGDAGPADVADPCDPGAARGGAGNGVTVNGLPSTGAGSANQAGLFALLAAASALGGVAVRLRAGA